jgi:hypothetical protein
MRPDPDPHFLTPEDRFREVAAVLAAGLLRLHARNAAAGAAPNNPQNSSLNCLEVPGETVLSVHTG